MPLSETEKNRIKYSLRQQPNAQMIKDLGVDSEEDYFKTVLQGVDNLEIVKEEYALLDKIVITNIPKERDELADYCIENEIKVYDLNLVNNNDKQELFKKLANLFLNKDGDISLWKSEFDRKISTHERNINNAGLHENQNTSIVNSAKLGKSINPKTLFSDKDMKLLLPNSVPVVSPSFVHENELREIEEGVINKKIDFIACSEEGHWFYLKREGENSWSVNDSMPFNQNGEKSQRQQNIFDVSKDFIRKIDLNASQFTFKSTEDQLNDFACGTHVVNAHQEQLEGVSLSHSDMITELLNGDHQAKNIYKKNMMKVKSELENSSVDESQVNKLRDILNSGNEGDADQDLEEVKENLASEISKDPSLLEDIKALAQMLQKYEKKDVHAKSLEMVLFNYYTQKDKNYDRSNSAEY